MKIFFHYYSNAKCFSYSNLMSRSEFNDSMLDSAVLIFILFLAFYISSVLKMTDIISSIIKVLSVHSQVLEETKTVNLF